MPPGPAEGSRTRTARDALLQGLELAVAARTGRIAMGTGVIEMRYKNPLLLTLPNQLGVDFNAKLPGTVVRHIAPAIGWSPSARRGPAAQ